MQDINPQEHLYRNAKPYFDSILSAIHHAQFQVDMEAYIFEVDRVGEQFADALIQAAQRGVCIRLLVDGFGVGVDFINAARSLKRAGAEVRIHRPLPWHVEQWSFSLSSIKGIQKLWYLLTFINKRNHRKLVIVDQRAVWLGSINISQKHLSSDQGGQNWRDTAIELHQLDTNPIQTAFNLNWNRGKINNKKRLTLATSLTPFLFNFTHFLRRSRRTQLLSRILEAQDQIWITNAYFVPNAKLLNALITASKKGVDVRIVLPYLSDVFFMPWVSSFYYTQLLQANVRIYEYQAGILHAKTLIIDNWASIGSSNFNQRSLRHDLEVDYTLQLSESVNQLEHDFIDDLKQSEELSQHELSIKKPWQRLVGGLVLILFSYWL